MQIFAFDSQGKLLPAHLGVKKESYYCPSCKSQMGVRMGDMRRAHFFHLKSSSCPFSNKSLTHIHLQYHIQEKLPGKIRLEERLACGRIADCFWEEKKLIFEIQCSKIPEKEISLRSHDYHQMGLKVVWILHEKSFGPLSLGHIPHYYSDFNEKGEGMIYDTLFYFPGKLPRLPVDLTSPREERAASFHHFVRNRKKRWKIGFKGDLLDPQNASTLHPYLSKRGPFTLFKMVLKSFFQRRK